VLIVLWRQGSSIADETLAAVRKAAAGARRVVVLLDSDHTQEHVLVWMRAAGWACRSEMHTRHQRLWGSWAC
jgi:cephalosporin hydroxylase